MPYLVEDFIESVKERTFAPISQSTFNDTKIITTANEEMELNLASELVVIREDFLLVDQNASIVANKSHYGIPERSIGNALKTLFYRDAAGVLRDPGLKLIDSSRRAEFAATGPEPEAFYFEGDEVVIVPTPTVSSGTLVFSFPGKPNQLIATASCAKITAVASNTPAASFTVNTDLTGSLSVGSLVDIISAKSPFKSWTYQAAITQITSSLIEVALTSVYGQDGSTIEPQVGDYICPSGFSNIPQIPTVYHPVLAQMVAVRVLSSLGDTEKLSSAEKALEKMLVKALKVIKNRVESSPKRVSNRRGLMRYL